jgi:hypothetical protein
MEVRAAYCAEDFEWEICKELAVSGTRSGNVELQREYASVAFKKPAQTKESE